MPAEKVGDASAYADSFRLLLELKLPSRRRRRSIVPPRAEFDLAGDDPEVEVVHEVAIAAHLAELASRGPDPLAIDDLVIAVAHGLDLSAVF